MELRDFVTATLTQLMEALAATAKKAKELGGEQNPSTLEWRTDQGQVVFYDSETDLMGSAVEFDIAVTATEGTEKGADGGIKVLGLGLGIGAKAQSTSENQIVSRVKFTVPVVFPTSKPKVAKAKVSR